MTTPATPDARTTPLPVGGLVQGAGAGAGAGSAPVVTTPPASDGTPGLPQHPADPTLPDATKVYIVIGRSGLQRWGGFVGEEWLRDLVGMRSYRVYREMWDNDAIIGAMKFMIQMLLRQTQWTVPAISDSPNDEAAAKYLESQLGDMDGQTWDDFLTQVMSMFAFGWHWAEMCFKVRRGPDQRDPLLRSKYNDGFVGVRRLAPRAQESWRRWVFDETTGDVLAMIQAPAPDFNEREIPRWKALAFRVTNWKDNPEGVSLLRSCYRSYWFRKRIQEVEGIGIERELAGYPVLQVPAELLSPNATPELAAMRAEFERQLVGVRRDELAAFMVPSEKDGYKFDLVSTGGSRQIDTNAVIERYSKEMATTVLADFILIGHQGRSGSKALVGSRGEMFAQAINAWNESIAEELNNRLVPLLFSLNRGVPGFPDVEELPKFRARRVDVPDLDAMSAFVTALSGAGIDIGSQEEIVNALLRQADLPEIPEETFERMREERDAQSAALRQAQAATATARAGAGGGPGAADKTEEEEDPGKPEAREKAWANAQERWKTPITSVRKQVLAAWQVQKRYAEAALHTWATRTPEATALVADVQQAAARGDTQMAVGIAKALRPFVDREAARAWRRARRTVHKRRGLLERLFVRKAAEDLPATIGKLAEELFAGALFARHVQKINDRTRGLIDQQIRRGLDMGESVTEIGKRLNQQLWIDSSRAMTIARTEVLGAMNAAQYTGYKEGGVEAFEWVSMHDARTRPDHAETDGQIRKASEPFDVGGEALRFPGDPNGSPENIINCRCLLVPATSA